MKNELGLKLFSIKYPCDRWRELIWYSISRNRIFPPICVIKGTSTIATGPPLDRLTKITKGALHERRPR